MGIFLAILAEVGLEVVVVMAESVMEETFQGTAEGEEEEEE